MRAAAGCSLNELVALASPRPPRNVNAPAAAWGLQAGSGVAVLSGQQGSADSTCVFWWRVRWPNERTDFRQHTQHPVV